VGEGAHSKHHACNLCCGERNDRERHNLSLEGPGPRVFESNVRDACFLKYFWAPNNVVKYDGKINPSVWLENYCHIPKFPFQNVNHFSLRNSKFPKDSIYFLLK
jgi:hypothetical protein